MQRQMGMRGPSRNVCCSQICFFWPQGTQMILPSFSELHKSQAYIHRQYNKQVQVIRIFSKHTPALPTACTPWITIKRPGVALLSSIYGLFSLLFPCPLNNNERTDHKISSWKGIFAVYGIGRSVYLQFISTSDVLIHKAIPFPFLSNGWFCFCFLICTQNLNLKMYFIA